MLGEIAVVTLLVAIGAACQNTESDKRFMSENTKKDYQERCRIDY